MYEGLPDYISSKVSAAEHLQWFDVFSRSYQPDIDSLFIKEVAVEKGKYILSFIGGKGAMPELSSEERSHYAPAFYHGSSLFVKYIAEHYDITILLSGISAFGEEHETIERLTGKSIATLKKEWLNQLKIVE